MITEYAEDALSSLVGYCSKQISLSPKQNGKWQRGFKLDPRHSKSSSDVR